MLKKDPCNMEIDISLKEYKRVIQMKKRQHFYDKTKIIDQLCEKLSSTSSNLRKDQGLDHLTFFA